MTVPKHTLRTLLGLGVFVWLAPASAPAQVEPVGVVTRLDGTATLARVATPDGMPLKLRDTLFVADRITTGDQSLARLLLGGKALVTVRERSTLTITESAGTSTVDVGLGKIAVAVVKERIKPGESVEIRTPNAVAAIRGTVVITEVSQATSQLGVTTGGITTTITVLRGRIEFRQIDRLTRGVTSAPISVGALQAVRVTGQAPPRPVHTITPEQAQSLARQYKVSIKDAPTTTNEPIAANQLRAAVRAAGGAAAESRGDGTPDIPSGSAATAASAPQSTTPAASSSSGSQQGPGASGPTASAPAVSGPTVSAPAVSAPTSAPAISAPAVAAPAVAPVAASAPVAPAPTISLPSPPTVSVSSGPAPANNSGPGRSGPTVQAPAPRSPAVSPVTTKSLDDNSGKQKTGKNK